jgi:hypothetical protein
MPDTVARLSEDGVCSFCLHDEGEVSYRGEDELRALLDRHKRESERTGRKYDCIVRVSGGKDSLSALYRLATEYDANVLAFNYEGAFTHPQATENLRRAAEILDVDFVIHRDDRVQKRYVAHNLKALLRRLPDRLPLMSHLVCTGCREGIDYPAIDLALKHGIKLMFSGGCPVEADLQWLVRLRRDSRVHTNLFPTPWKLRGVRAKEALADPFFWHPGYWRNVLRYLALPSPVPYALKKLRGVESTAFYDYCRWGEKEIIALLEEDLGWRRPAGQSTTKRFDCKLHPILNAIRRKYTGVCEEEVQLSCMIRRGLLTREAAMERLRTSRRDEEEILPGVIREVADAAGIPEAGEELVKLLA